MNRRLIRVHILPSAILIALLFQTGALTLLAAPDNGWFEAGCAETTFHILMGDKASSEQLVLQLSTGTMPPWVLLPSLAGAEPRDVLAMRCSSDNKCEERTRGKIWLNRVKGKVKRISGRYEVDVGGRHFEGLFTTKIRKAKPPILCE
jgi:hypothetical protein